jgi:hypothetical protein
MRMGFASNLDWANRRVSVGGSMGDLRNKMAKQLRDAQHSAYMAMR